MGQDKALLRRDGRSQLALAFALLEQVTDRTFVSTRADQQHDAERGRFPQIVDHDDNIGPVAGILSAMQKFPNMDWLVVACDLPNLDLQTLTNLLAHRLEDSPFIAYRSSHDGLPEPLCAVYRRGSDAIVKSFVDEGVVCPRKILIRSDTLLLDQPNPAALDNINTPEDLAKSVLDTLR